MRQQNSTLYLKGYQRSAGKAFYIVEDSLSYEEAQKLKQKLKNSGHNIRVKYSAKYDDFAVWSDK